MQCAPISLPSPSAVGNSNAIASSEKRQAPSTNKWSADEHDRYLTALELYPKGSWKLVAEFVGTRTVRQVMSHAQKIAQKKQRHSRGLKRAGRPRRAVPESPSSIEHVDTTTSYRRPPYETRPDMPTTYQTATDWGLQENEIVIDEELMRVDAALFETEEGFNSAEDGRPRWSPEDCEWLAELMRLSRW